MKKFKWRLERLLDIRQKQEEALRAELMGLAEQAAALRGRILMEKAMLRSRLAELRKTAAADRLSRQELFMEKVSVIDARIAACQHELNDLEQKRKKKTEAIMAARKSRKALEQLRQQAYERYRQDLNAEAQKDQDENTNAAFVRKVLEVG